MQDEHITKPFLTFVNDGCFIVLDLGCVGSNRLVLLLTCSSTDKSCQRGLYWPVAVALHTPDWNVINSISVILHTPDWNVINSISVIRPGHMIRSVWVDCESLGSRACTTNSNDS